MAVSVPATEWRSALHNVGSDCVVQTAVQVAVAAPRLAASPGEKDGAGKCSCMVVRRMSDAGDAVCRRRSPRKTAAPVADFR